MAIARARGNETDMATPGRGREPRGDDRPGDRLALVEPRQPKQDEGPRVDAGRPEPDGGRGKVCGRHLLVEPGEETRVGRFQAQRHLQAPGQSPGKRLE